MAVMDDAVFDDSRRIGVTIRAARIMEHALAGLVGALDPADVPMRDTLDVWRAFDRMERLSASAKTLLAARVEATGAWKRSGARSAAEHLAHLGGNTTSAARRSLSASGHLTELPALAATAREGTLSSAQLTAIAAASAADPSAQARLVELAQTTNVTELREECLRVQAAADPDPDATHRRIRNGRRARMFKDGEGAWNLSARGTADAGAAFEAALSPIIDELFEQARTDGRKEPREAYAFDALMRLAHREPAPEDDAQPPRPKPRYLALLHVDVQALTRGAVAGEETCEIIGFGTIPVRVARELLGDAILKLVITNGVDVVNVTHLGRGATAAQRIALLWSKPKCADRSCSSQFVQIDHRIPWATTKHTKLDELDPLCPHHHRLKTNAGWSLERGTGRRAFVPPADPRHPRHKPPPSRVRVTGSRCA